MKTWAKHGEKIKNMNFRAFCEITKIQESAFRNFSVAACNIPSGLQINFVATVK